MSAVSACKTMVDLRDQTHTVPSSHPAASTCPLGCHSSHCTSLPGSNVVRNSQSFHVATSAGSDIRLTRRQNRTRPSIPPVADHFAIMRPARSDDGVGVTCEFDRWEGVGMDLGR